jgi:purine catabolism regulator
MVTVGDCLNLEELADVKIAAGAQGLGRAVRMTHAVDEPDVSTWVEPDILVLTTAQNYPADGDTWGELVCQLDARGVAALIVSPGRYLRDLPPAALREADRLGFPVLVVPWELPFIRITAAIHRLLLKDHIHQWSRVAELGVRITEAAVRAKSLDSLLGAFAELIGSEVSLELEAALRGGEAGRKFPLPSPELEGWSLWVQSWETSAAESIVARQMAATLAIWILQQKISADDEFEVQAATLDHLLSGQPELFSEARDRLRIMGIRPNRACRLLLLTLPAMNDRPGTPRAVDDARMIATQLLQHALLLSTTHPMGLLCLIDAERAAVPSPSGSYFESFFRRFPQSVGVLSAPSGLEELAALKNAMARMVPLLPPGGVHDMTSTLFAAVVVNLPDDLMQGYWTSTWQRLDETLIKTLRILIQSGGNRTDAALRLQVHRNTMTRRIQLIEAKLGQRLTPPLLTELDVADQWMAVRTKAQD